MTIISAGYRYGPLLIFAATPALAQPTFKEDMARQRAEQQRNEEAAE